MARHRFDVTSSRTLHVGAIVALRRDEVTMPGGRVAAREVVEHPGAVAILALDERHRVVLIEQYRHAVARRLWELPAGLLDRPGEDPAETARRELVEEVGLAAADWSVLVDVVTSPGFADESVRVFLARGLSVADRPAGDDDEESELRIQRVGLDEAVRRVLAGEIVNGPACSGLLAAHAIVSGADAPRGVDAPWPDRPTRFAARRDASA